MMTKLNKNWLTEGVLDFEYKKYVLLAYLQCVKAAFSRQELFPELTELHDHLNVGLQLRKEKEALQHLFPKIPVKVDMKERRIRYEPVFTDEKFLSELIDILDYALPLLSQTFVEGNNRIEEIQAELIFSPVGIMPLRNEEGYLFISSSRSFETTIYRYNVTLYNTAVQREVKTVLVDSVRKGISTTYENIKLGLTKKYHQLPNPATYIVESKRDYPLQETLLPLAKQLMVRNLVFT